MVVTVKGNPLLQEGVKGTFTVTQGTLRVSGNYQSPRDRARAVKALIAFNEDSVVSFSRKLAKSKLTNAKTTRGAMSGFNPSLTGKRNFTRRQLVVAVKLSKLCFN